MKFSTDIQQSSYQKLPEQFHEKIKLNLGLNWKLEISNDDLIDKDLLKKIMARANNEDAFALAYSGHQFGHFSPVLGDGRAALIGSLKDEKDGEHEIHLKGSGRTVFSRGGDGKATLGSVVREYLLSEAMAGLNVPTTRTLGILTSDETIARQELHPRAVLIRCAKSHIRVGTFEYFSSRDDYESIKILVNQFKFSSPVEFFKDVVRKQAELIAKWMSVGFIHGVMNTDNMLVSGETIDYGPCAFMDEFDPHKVFSSIDRNGRYRFSNQASIARWNLAKLSECLSLTYKNDLFLKELENFDEIFKNSWFKLMSAKIGIEFNPELVNYWLQYLSQHELDFTLAHIWLHNYDNGLGYSELVENEAFKNFLKMRESCSSKKSLNLMQKVNPVVIARNHQVERIIKETESGSWQSFTELNRLLKNPYDLKNLNSSFTRPPLLSERVQETFCGT